MRRAGLLIVLGLAALTALVLGGSDDDTADPPSTTVDPSAFALRPVLVADPALPCAEEEVAGARNAGGCFELGPVVVDASAFESAEAGLDVTGQDWQVNPVFRTGDPGIDTFNAIAHQCFGQVAECPTGQIAIVVDGVVVAAPSVEQDGGFARDRIQILGDFTQAEAEALAEVLSP